MAQTRAQPSLAVPKLLKLETVAMQLSRSFVVAFNTPLWHSRLGSAPPRALHAFGPGRSEQVSGTYRSSIHLSLNTSVRLLDEEVRHAPLMGSSGVLLAGGLNRCSFPLGVLDQLSAVPVRVIKWRGKSSGLGMA